MGNLLAGLGLSVALLTGVMLMFIGLSSEAGRDGGRAMGAAIASLPFLAGLALAYIVATLRGGFDWLGLPRPVTLLLVLVALVAAVLVNFFSVGLRLEPASQVPWAMWPLRAWLHWFWPPLLLLGAAWALWPANFGWPPQWGRTVLAMAGLVSLLVCGLMLVQWAWASQQQQAQRVQQRIQDDQKRDAWVREQVIAADPQKDLVLLMNQTSKYETPDIRALALQKVRSHPQLNPALATMLRNGWRDKAFVFLESNAPPDAPALAEAVRDGMLGMAGEIRQRMKDTHTLRADDFMPEVERMLAVAEQFALHARPEAGLDYREAMQAVRQALDQPRHQASGTPDLIARHRLDRWLAGQGSSPR